jgi:hypothetical protein
MSAVTVGFNAESGGIIPIATNILSFDVINSLNITYNTVTGDFTSFVGPGFYEVTWGAAWTGFATLVLLVDGVEVIPHGAMNIQSDWATESMIVQSSATTPIFAIGNSSSSAAAMTLFNNGALNVATGFVTIKKIN